MNRHLTLTFVPFALAALVLAGSCDRGEKKVLIRYKYEPGTEMDFRLSLEGPNKTYVHDSLTESWYVKAVEDYTQTVRRVLDDSTTEFHLTGKWTTTRQRLDETGVADSVIAREAPAPEMLVYGKPNGRITDVQLLSDTSQAEEAYLKQHYEQAYPVFPDEPVGPGYSWTQSTRVMLPDGPTDATATYTIKGYDRVDGYDCVIIEYDNLTIIPLLPHKSRSGELLSGVHRIRSVGRLDFAYREGLEVHYKERWTLDAAFQFQPTGKKDVFHYKQLIEYDADIVLLDIKKP